MRLFRDSHEQGTGQFAVGTNEGCVVGFVVLAQNGRGPRVERRHPKGQLPSERLPYYSRPCFV